MNPPALKYTRKSRASEASVRKQGVKLLEAHRITEAHSLARVKGKAIMSLEFTILGAPRTKKTHGRVIVRGGRKYHVQSVAHERWHAEAMLRLASMRAGWLLQSMELPLTQPLHVKAMFWRDRRSGDLVGFQQALGDLLENAGIIANDKLIESWDGTRLNTKVALTPRIEVEIRRMIR